MISKPTGALVTVPLFGYPGERRPLIPDPGRRGPAAC